MNRRGKLARLGLALSIVALALVGLLAADRRPLRAAERAYLDGRDVTACATRELRPFAQEDRDLDELPEALEGIIVEARDDARAVRERRGAISSGLLPRTRSAVEAVLDALDAQVALYDAMVDDPAGSDDELAALGRANNVAERRLETARNGLLAGEAEGWARRFTCRSGADRR